MPKIGMSSSAMIMANWLDALKAATQNDFDAFEITCVFPSADPQDIPSSALAEAREILQQNPVEICVHAPFFEINIAIDDTSIDRCFDDLLEIREAVGKSLKFTLDMGHSRLSEGTAEGIRVLGDAIGHVHLSDNFGEKDDHLPLGDRNYDYSDHIDFLKNFDQIYVGVDDRLRSALRRSALKMT